MLHSRCWLCRFVSQGQSSMVYIYHGPPKPNFLEVFMVNNLVFRWPKPLFFMVLGAVYITASSWPIVSIVSTGPRELTTLT